MLNMAEGIARLGALAETAPVAQLARAFADAGHELAIVGGPVRDALLGRPTHDLDFTTDARPDRILAIVTPRWSKPSDGAPLRVEGPRGQHDVASMGTPLA